LHCRHRRPGQAMTGAMLTKLSLPGRAFRSWLWPQLDGATHSIAVTQYQRSSHCQIAGRVTGMPLQPLPHGSSRDRRCPATRACRGARTGASETVAAEGSCAPAGPGSSSAMPGTGARSSGGGGWERGGNHGRSRVRCAALFCSPGRGVHLRKHGKALVAGMWMLSWGSRGRRFKSGRPDGFSNTCTPKWERKLP